MTPEPTSLGATHPCTDERYGAHAEAHTAVCTFAGEVALLVESCTSEELPARVAAAMKPVLETPGLLCAAHRQGADAKYRKHILYADPDHRFTLLALIWRPGQGTVVHGHTAWGAVGVYEGTPNVTIYACSEREDGKHEAVPVKDIPCRPGDTAIVRPGLCDTHRIYNASESGVITLHMYGIDLVQDPDAINLYLDL